MWPIQLSSGERRAMSNDTIYALSSAAGRAAVAVVRVSGGQVQRIVTAMAGKLPSARVATLCRIVRPGDGQAIDDAIVLFFAAPHSATGEDVAEFHIHGGRAVLQAVFDVLAMFDNCRPAEPGEFTHRGFDNGKLDLTAAEGIADLVDAETEAQRIQALHQAGGELARLYDDWRARLIEVQGLVEAAIDFSDEADVSDKAVVQARNLAAPLRAAIADHLAGAERGEIIRAGLRVVIAGPPNAGKSSLLNALARRDVAIVSDEAGTTRDVIEVHLDLDGLPVIVSDTAGVREAASKVEREGIRRTFDRARNADLVLWIEDATAPNRIEPGMELHDITVIRLRNKIDLLPDSGARLGPAELDISVKQGIGIKAVTDAVARAATERVGLIDQVVPTNARHRRHLESARDQLDSFLSADRADLELRAEDLRIAASALGRLTGRIDVEDVLDQIFSRFCIGK